MSTKVNPFDLKKQLAFYGAYHTNPTNIAIHMVGVPSIIFATSLLLATYGSILPKIQPFAPDLASGLIQVGTLLSAVLPAWLFSFAQLDWAAVFMASYWIYYTILDYVGALLLAPIWYALWYSSTYVAQTHPDAVKISAIVFTLGWVFQFYGHGVHEGRAPALLDNLLGAVVLAPFFVFLETIFLFGYRPELHKWLKNETGKMVTEFRRKRAQQKRAKAS